MKLIFKPLCATQFQKCCYSRGAQIQSSIGLYLSKVKEQEKLLENEKAEFEKGKRYLASMMGEDPQIFSQESIDEAIRYLLPSGLYNIGARPKLKLPDEIFPKQKRLQVARDGRPLQHLFYTGKPNFYNICHEASAHLESLKRKIDYFHYSKDKTIINNIRKLELLASEWLTKGQLENLTLEKIKPHQYNDWLFLMNRLAEHELAYLAEDFIIKYRTYIKKIERVENELKPEIDPENPSRKFIQTYGQKKNSFAEIKFFYPGTGEIKVNDKSFLELFPYLGDREQVMFPLVLTDLLMKVDINAKVDGPELAHASKANALRLAISRAIATFDGIIDQKSVEDHSEIPKKNLHDHLLVSGLLTQDDRFRERKKPGQPKARKKFIWKAR